MEDSICKPRGGTELHTGNGQREIFACRNQVRSFRRKITISRTTAGGLLQVQDEGMKKGGY
jgi:hypothetical protein